MNHIKIFRHLEENPTVDNGQRTGKIIESEKYLAYDHYAPTLAALAFNQRSNRVIILHSASDRSTETASLVADCISAQNSLTVELELDTKLSALQHGYYKGVAESEHPLASYAQRIYLDESFRQNNPNYKHGDSVMLADGTYKYPALNKIFIRPGESQSDLSFRVYNLAVNIIDRVDKNPSETLSLSTHFVIMSRLLALEAISKTIILGDEAMNWDVGSLYKLEWDVGEDMTAREGYKNFFKSRNYNFDINIEYLAVLKSKICNELDFIELGRGNE